VAARDLEHALDRLATDPASLDGSWDHDHEGAEDIRRAFVEPAGDRSVDPGGQVVDRAVPAEGNRARTREDPVAVDEMELEVR
jgi:hypothetical protein